LGATPSKPKEDKGKTIEKCGSKAFQVYFDHAKDSSQEPKVKQVSRIKESFNQDSRLK